LAEKVVYETYPSWIYYWKQLAVAITIPVFAILFISVLGIYLPDFISVWIAVIVIFSSVFISLSIVVYVWFERSSHKLKITENKIIYEEGFFSKKIKEIKKTDIRSVEIDQSFIDRLLNIGTLKIATPATSGYEIIFYGLRNPASVKSKIEQLRKGGKKGSEVKFKERILKKSVRFKKKSAGKNKKVLVKVYYSDRTDKDKKEKC